ncbi:KTSC domain-containing protein [Clostridioides sp. ES-S-0108-01]|uniref:KTSC domain-containing protein n=1 Tax=Clostridioides sp. ES-S-0108-01 TaxID=2770773 RepID=UPI001D0BF778|nr:KTSC domain-containing protein [Clostridioides sp. ES-S-0108-01]UDN52184.1 KTSC domain-containing protein [Clostridioides sp. ES-S-0107-01]
MNMMPVSSRRIRSVGWENNTLYVQFHNGVTYVYLNVSETEYQNFLSSPSLGSELSRLDKIHPYHKL